MRAIFIKELRQGRLLVVFGIALALLIPLLHFVLARSPLHGRDPEALSRTFGWLIFILPPIIALFAGSKLFSSEVDRDTLPLLLNCAS